MPTPRASENRDDFLKRCIPMLINEGKPKDQAIAVCNAMWVNREAKINVQKMATPNLKEIELIVEDENTDFLTAMGFVSSPAIEVPLMYFNNSKSNYTLAKLDEEQGIVVSPALIPEKRIYRYNQFTNEEYYVYFSKETIRKLSQNFLISGHHVNTTEEHTQPIKGVHLIYSWIVENQHDQIITKYGFKNIPDGTWVVSYKIENEDIKEKIRNGEIRGLSIEAWLSEKFDNSSHSAKKDEDLIEQIKNVLKEIE